MNIPSRLYVVIGIASIVISAGGVVYEDPSETVQASEAAPRLEATQKPDIFVSPKGKRYIRLGPVKKFAAKTIEQEKVQERRSASKPKETELSREELAKKLRGVSFYDGHEYVLDKPDYVLADAILNARRNKKEGKQSSPGRGSAQAIDSKVMQEKLSSSRSSRAVLGADNRQLRRDNTLYPMRTQVHLSTGCSGTMVGPSTMLSAAHCFHDRTNWRPTQSWSPGVDAEDAWNAYPYNPWGTTYPDTANNSPVNGCYWVTIPSAFIGSSQGDREFDYAVVEFANGYPNCNLQPGNTVGWLGVWLLSNSQIESNIGYIYGYPGEKTPYPQIWGIGGGLQENGYEIRYEIDTTGGQSGSGVYSFVGTPDRYVVGIHSGSRTNFFGSTVNISRRITDSVWNFIQQHSAL